MNKNDFFFFNAVNEDDKPFPAVIKKRRNNLNYKNGRW